MTRKIIQIAVHNEPSIVYALCDDGSVWSLWVGQWTKDAPIPQD